jgi:hypothetical protein
MSVFVRRFRQFPPIEQLTSIESMNVVDLTPPFPTTGVGTGTLLIVGEFEDGPFAGGDDSSNWDAASKGQGPQEIYSSEDYRQRFGGFGYTYGSTNYSNACARRHLSELWNGNGFLKTKFVRAQRMVLARVDTSVGSVAFSNLACIEGGTGPFNCEPGQQISATTDQGGPASSTALAAVKATAAGTAGTFPTLFAGGEQIGITIDSNPEVIVTFSAADQTNSQVVSRINAALGFTSAVLNTGQVDITGIVRGTAGSVVLRNITTGTLATLGHTAGTTAGTGNVGNIDAVTSAEIATIVNATVALSSIDCAARVSQDGRIRICSTTPAVGTINITSTTLSTVLGLTPVATTVAAGTHAAGTIPAGTRVRTAGGAEWVTMQTLTISEGTSASPVGGPYVVKVRPALDDGTATGTSAATVVTVVDQPTFGELAVTNPQALTAAKDEPAVDSAYQTAFDRTLVPSGVTREINFSLCARQSDAIRALMKSNAEDASSHGCFGRKALVSAPIGFSQSQAIAQVALNRLDRVSYTWPGLRVRIPEIAEIGTAGGLGFSGDGVITVRADGPLASINCQIPPEDNPGQQTNLIDLFFEVEQTPTPLNETSYVALRAAGICAPRVDRVSGTIFQSGITTSLEAALKTQARRKMADFIQDSLSDRLISFGKKPSTQENRDAIRAIVDQFLSELRSASNPALQRIEDYSVDETSGNTPDTLARGIFVIILKVRTLASLDFMVLQTEIGEAVTVTQV